MSSHWLKVGLSLVCLALAIPLTGQGRPGSTSSPTATPIPPFVKGQPPEGKALIYFYSKNGMNVGDTRYGFLIMSQNGPITILGTYRYYTYVTDPGHLRFFAVTPTGLPLKFNLDAVPGQSYFVTFTQGFNVMSWDMVVVPRETALKEIRDLAENKD